eukprot:sb/3471397/
MSTNTTNPTNCVQLFPVVGWVKQVIPEKIATLARNLEEVSAKLTKKLSREVETEINELNELLALQDQLNQRLKTLLECKGKCVEIPQYLSSVLDRCCALYTAIQSLSHLNPKYVIPFKTFKAWVVDSISGTSVAPPSTLKQNEVYKMDEESILSLLKGLQPLEESTTGDMLKSVTANIWKNVSM